LEGTILIHLKKLPEVVYLPTNAHIQGLIGQCRTTITETLEIASDVVKKLFEAQSENGGNMRKLAHNFNYPLETGI